MTAITSCSSWPPSAISAVKGTLLPPCRPLKCGKLVGLPLGVQAATCLWFCVNRRFSRKKEHHRPCSPGEGEPGTRTGTDVNNITTAELFPAFHRMGNRRRASGSWPSPLREQGQPTAARQTGLSHQWLHFATRQTCFPKAAIPPVQHRLPVHQTG